MFNNLLTPIPFYIILGLSISTLGFGYLSYSLSNDKAVAVHALKESQGTVAEREKSLNLAYLSCKQDDASILEVEAEKKELVTKIDTVSNNIEKLRIPKPHVKQEIIKNENLKETNVLPDDGMLSANIVGLLREGYCAVEPTDNQCISSGQPSGQPL